MMVRFLTRRLAIVLFWSLAGWPVAISQELSSQIGLDELRARLDAQAAQIRGLQSRLDRQENVTSGWTNFELIADEHEESCDDGYGKSVPLTAEMPAAVGCDGNAASEVSRTLRFYADFADGFRIRPFDQQKHPFELKVNGWIQFRHHRFESDVSTWTDNAGVTRLVRDRSAFDIERGRLIFSGYVWDERLTYFLQLDGDTDDGHAVDFFDYFWAWKVSDRLKIQLGKRKVPAGRQWLLTARKTRLVDRPMANDFFRPDRTVGLFVVGNLGSAGHYEWMLGNSYRSANLANAAIDDRCTFGANYYVEPWGQFGNDIVDFAWSDTPLIRLGHSFVYSPQRSDVLGVPLAEANFLRLSDGTRLTQNSALAPGATVSEYDLTFYGLDASWKWRGWSFNTEAFFRWIDRIRADAALPVRRIDQRGYYVEGGCFLVPKRFDFNVRYSQVSGEYGNASERAAGVNWYPAADPHVKLSFDVTSLDGSPLQNTASDILVGDDGILFRSQFQAEF